MFNSLSWPPGILPPPSATEKKKQGVERRSGEESGRGEGKTKWYLYGSMRASPFSPAYMPHPQRWYIDGGFGLIPVCSNNTDAGFEESPGLAGNSRCRRPCWGAFPEAEQTRRFTALCKANCSWHSWHRVTCGHLSHKSNRKRDVALPRSGSVTQLPPDDLFHLFFSPDL